MTIQDLCKKRSGFTLVELLVVIAIIGILASITLVGLRTMRARAQDTQRKTDISQINKALLAYGAENGEKYPVSLGNWGDCNYLTGAPEQLIDDGSSCTTEALKSGGFLSSMPSDKVWTDYFQYYNYASTGSSYTLSAKLAGRSGILYTANTDSGGKNGFSDVPFSDPSTDPDYWSTLPGIPWGDVTVINNGNGTHTIDWPDGYNNPYFYYVVTYDYDTGDYREYFLYDVSQSSITTIPLTAGHFYGMDIYAMDRYSNTDWNGVWYYDVVP